MPAAFVTAGMVGGFQPSISRLLAWLEKQSPCQCHCWKRNLSNARADRAVGGTAGALASHCVLAPETEVGPRIKEGVVKKVRAGREFCFRLELWERRDGYEPRLVLLLVLVLLLLLLVLLLLLLGSAAGLCCCTTIKSSGHAV